MPMQRALLKPIIRLYILHIRQTVYHVYIGFSKTILQIRHIVGQLLATSFLFIGKIKLFSFSSRNACEQVLLLLRRYNRHFLLIYFLIPRNQGFLTIFHKYHLVYHFFHNFDRIVFVGVIVNNGKFGFCITKRTKIRLIIFYLIVLNILLSIFF